MDEEGRAISAGVMPDTGQTGGDEHARDRVTTDPGEEAKTERAERPKGRTAEAGTKEDEQRGERTGILGHRRNPRGQVC